MAAYPLPVPRSTIIQYLRLVRLDPDEMHEFVEIVAAIDDVYVEIEIARLAKEAKDDAAKRKHKERGGAHG